MVPMGVKSKNYPLIPEEERKCVWMTTGFISYKLCDRNFYCETCPFDQAIKNENSKEGDYQELEDDWTEGLLKTDPSTRISGSIFYHPDHCWVKVDHPEKVKIGIDDLITRLITNVKVIVLPRVGSFIGQGECCAHVIQEDYILPVIAPLSGTIQAVNPRLKKESNLLTDDPRGEGWLVMIKPDNLESELKKLLFGRKALTWYKGEEKAIIARVDRILKHHPKGVGPTMQDGGVRIDCLPDLLNHVTSQQKTQILDFSITRQK
jgi:glycine cleavage system H protein